jgi:predicted XRE-type DNA-binding protein
MTAEAQIFDDVFDALADTPAEAANLKARADLLAAVERRIALWSLSPEDTAERLGLSPSRLEDLRAGRLGLFSLDALVDIATAAGLALEIRTSDAA